MKCTYCGEEIVSTKNDYYVGDNGSIACTECADEHLETCEYGLYDPKETVDPDLLLDDELADVEIFKLHPAGV